jgi:hypothetical protein
MNNTFFDSPLLRILNTLLLAGILGIIVLIFLHIPREPLEIDEPISVEGVRSASGHPPVQVEISRAVPIR